MKHLMFLLMAGVACLASAREVTPAEAETAALAWAKKNTAFANGTVGVEGLSSVTNSTGSTLYFKVLLNDQTLLILAGDTRIDPVIAVLKNAEPDIPEEHPLVSILAADLSNRLEIVSADEVSDEVAESMNKAEMRWLKLLGRLKVRALNANGEPSRTYTFLSGWDYGSTTGRLDHWNQQGRNKYYYTLDRILYNKYTPYNYPAGCVPIVGAALVQWAGVRTAPKVSSYCYIDSTHTNLTTCGIDYDWDLLSTCWSTNTILSEAQKDLVGRVAYDVGICIGYVKYTSSGTGGSVYSLAYALRSDFGFQSARWMNGVGATRLEKLVYTQTRSGAPVVLRLTGGAGHAVLAVGYGEDDEGTPYTRIFMGWGGSSDAWYALPAVNDYKNVSEVITQINPSVPASIGICGRLLDAAGNPEPWTRVTVCGSTLMSGPYGEFGGCFSKETIDANPTISYNGSSVEVTVGADYYKSEAATAVESLPGPVTLQHAGTTPLTVYANLDDARAAALAEEKLIFFLSGSQNCESCSSTKAYLRSIANKLNENFVVCAMMKEFTPETEILALDCCSYCVFDPRAIDASNAWFAGPQISSDSGYLPSKIEAVIDSASNAWESPVITSVLIQGVDQVVETSSYSLVVTYSTGEQVIVTEGITWSSSDEAIATVSNGVVQPVAFGEITLRASVSLDGSVHSVSNLLSVSAFSEITSLLIRVPTTLDMDREPNFQFTCWAQVKSDASNYYPTDPQWEASIAVTSPSSYSETVTPSIDANGKLTLDKINFYRATLTVTALVGDKTETVTATLYPPARYIPLSWSLDQSVIYPGSVLRVKDLEIYKHANGKMYLSGIDLSKAEYKLYCRTYGYRNLKIIQEDAADLLLAIPKDINVSAPTNLTFRLYSRNADPNVNQVWTYLSSRDVTVTLNPLGTTLGAEMEDVPCGWISNYFPEATTYDLQVAKAKEDSDGDGVLNWKEYVAGTDPTDPSSVFKITSIVPREGDIPDITWSEESPGRTYTLLGSETLEGGGTWETPTPQSRFFKVVVDMEN